MRPQQLAFDDPPSTVRSLPPLPPKDRITQARITRLSNNFAMRARRMTTSRQWATEHRHSRTRRGKWLPVVSKNGTPKTLGFRALRRRRRQWMIRNTPNTRRPGRLIWLRPDPAGALPNAPPEVNPQQL